MLPVEHRKILPAVARRVKPLELVRNPARFIIRGGQLRDANPLAFRLGRLQHLFREIRADFILRNHLRGYSQNIRRRTVILRQRHAVGSGIRAGFPPRESFQKELEAAERRAAESVDGLIVVAHDQDVARFGREQMQQLQLRDVGILKFIHQDMFVAFLQFCAQARIFFQQRDRFGDQFVQGHGVLRAQQLFAGTIDTRNLLLLRHLLRSLLEGVLVEQGALRLELRGQAVHIPLVILARHQLILAAREELDEVAQELPGLRETAVLVQL